MIVMDYDCILNIFHIFLYTDENRTFLYLKKKFKSLQNKNKKVKLAGLSWLKLFFSACPAEKWPKTL